MKTIRLGLMATVLLAALISPAASDDSLSRINVTVPFAEGGGSDTLVRIVAPFLRDELPGSPTVLIQNQPGGGGIPGSNRFVGTAKPDGSDLLALSSSVFVAAALRDPQIRFKLEDFLPVYVSPLGPVFYVSPTTGAKGPGDVAGIGSTELVFGGGRQLSADALTVMQFDLLGIKIRPVWGVERGAARIAFERGEFTVDQQTTAAYNANVKPLIDEGKAIPFMTAGYIQPDGQVVRDPVFSELPTFLELYQQVHGKALSGPAYRAWYALTVAAISTGKAIVLPANASKSILQAYDTAFSNIFQKTEFQKAAEQTIGGYQQVTGEEARALLAKSASMDDEAFDWLDNWFRERIGIQLKK